VVSVPLGCLKAGQITFQPPLPPWKQEAVERLGFGTLNKVIFGCAPFACADGRSDRHCCADWCLGFGDDVLFPLHCLGGDGQGGPNNQKFVQATRCHSRVSILWNALISFALDALMFEVSSIGWHEYKHR